MTNTNESLPSQPADLERLAEQASRETSRWYGRVARFNAPYEPWVSCKDFFLAHWRKHPSTAPRSKP